MPRDETEAQHDQQSDRVHKNLGGKFDGMYLLGSPRGTAKIATKRNGCDPLLAEQDLQPDKHQEKHKGGLNRIRHCANHPPKRVAASHQSFGSNEAWRCSHAHLGMERI